MPTENKQLYFYIVYSNIIQYKIINKTKNTRKQKKKK